MTNEPTTNPEVFRQNAIGTAIAIVRSYNQAIAGAESSIFERFNTSNTSLTPEAADAAINLTTLVTKESVALPEGTIKLYEKEINTLGFHIPNDLLAASEDAGVVAILGQLSQKVNRDIAEADITNPVGEHARPLRQFSTYLMECGLAAAQRRRSNESVEDYIATCQNALTKRVYMNLLNRVSATGSPLAHNAPKPN